MKESERAMYFLDQKDMPTHWYNIQADMPTPLSPPLNPATNQPINPDELGIFSRPEYEAKYRLKMTTVYQGVT